MGSPKKKETTRAKAKLNDKIDKRKVGQKREIVPLRKRVPNLSSRQVEAGDCSPKPNLATFLIPAFAVRQAPPSAPPLKGGLLGFYLQFC